MNKQTQKKKNPPKFLKINDRLQTVDTGTLNMKTSEVHTQVQLTLEQHGCELYGSTYMCIFSINIQSTLHTYGCGSHEYGRPTMGLEHPWISVSMADSGTNPSRAPRDDYISYSN